MLDKDCQEENPPSHSPLCRVPRRETGTHNLPVEEGHQLTPVDFFALALFISREGRAT